VTVKLPCLLPSPPPPPQPCVHHPRSSTFKKGRSLYIKLGDKDVEYNKCARARMAGRLERMHAHG